MGRVRRMSDRSPGCKYPGCGKPTAVRVALTMREAMSGYDTEHRGSGKPIPIPGQSTWSLCEDHKFEPVRAAQRVMLTGGGNERDRTNRCVTCRVPRSGSMRRHAGITVGTHARP